MTNEIALDRQLAAEHDGLRLDQAAARVFPEYSRARLQEWIREGQLRVNGQPARVRDRVRGDEHLNLVAVQEAREHHEPEHQSLDIVFEDKHLLVINKPVGLVVHPAAGNHSGTLLNGLLGHCPALSSLPRAGIVHRLDKDTSGLLVVAKTLQAHQDLVAQLQQRSMSRQYEAVVQGIPTAGGTVDEAIGRHPAQRQKRAVSNGPDAREAITHYRVLARFRSHAHLQLQLETGRTHQIRVHMAHIGFPIVGDQVYGGRFKPPKGAAPELLAFLQQFKRQALHAKLLGLSHPKTGKLLEWQVPLPGDMVELLRQLELDRG